MAPVQVNDLIERLRRFELLTSDQLRDLTASAETLTSAESFVEFLTQRGWLTSYQLDHLLLDRLGQLTLGGYRLLEPIGAGGMGEVFRALQIKLNRLAALKLIRKEFAAAHSDALPRFRREALAVAKLAHPNIVVIYDADEQDGTHYIAMEYVPGLDMSRMVKERGPLPVDVACEYIRQAALGLQHAFENDLVHRDIKPSNLLVALPDGGKGATIDYQRGLVKVLDLGLARITSEENLEISLTKERGVMGTPDYISPEQAREPKTADIRSDIYSLGCTFYFLLAGHPPFPQGNPIEKVMAHQLERPRGINQIRRDVPQAVTDIFRRLLAKRREDRYQTPAELANALGQHLGIVPRIRTDAPAEPRPPSKHGVEPRPPKSDPAAKSPTIITRVSHSGDDQSQSRSLLLSAASEAGGLHAPAEPIFEGTHLPGSTFAGLFEEKAAGQVPSTPCRIVKACSIQDIGAGEFGPAPLPTQCVAVLQGHHAPVVTMTFSRRGKYLATGGLDHSVRVWVLEGEDFRQVSAFHDPRLGEIQALVFSPSCQHLMVGATGFGGRVWQWRWQDRLDREMHGLDGGGSAALSLSPDGCHVAAANAGNVTIWRASSGVPKQRGVLVGRGPEIVSTAFAADGQQLFCGDVRGIVQSWRLTWRKFRADAAFAAHVGPVHVLAASPDGKRIATGGTDNAVRLWSVEAEPDLVSTISIGLRGVVRRLQFNAQGDLLQTVSDAGQAAEWRAEDGQKIAEWRFTQLVASSQAIADHGRLVALGRTDGTVNVHAMASPGSGEHPVHVVKSAPSLYESQIS